MRSRPLVIPLAAGMLLCLAVAVGGLAWYQASRPARWLITVAAPDGTEIRFGSSPDPRIFNFPYNRSDYTLAQVRQNGKTRTYVIKDGGEAINHDVAIYRHSTTGELLFTERDRLIAHYVPSQRWFMDWNYVQVLPLEGEERPLSPAPHQDLSGFPSALDQRGKEWELLAQSS